MNLAWLQALKPCTKVDMIDPFSGLPCASGEICGMPGTTFYGNLIALGHYTVAVTTIKRGSTRPPFPNLNTSKVDDMGNGIVLWHERDLIVIQ
jgi:hypothetical protein